MDIEGILKLAKVKTWDELEIRRTPYRDDIAVFEWREEGYLHRIDGPARIAIPSYVVESFYLFGWPVDERDHELIVKHKNDIGSFVAQFFKRMRIKNKNWKTAEWINQMEAMGIFTAMSTIASKYGMSPEAMENAVLLIKTRG